MATLRILLGCTSSATFLLGTIPQAHLLLLSLKGGGGGGGGGVISQINMVHVFVFLHIRSPLLEANCYI